jgi:hypothetical protein
MLCSEFVCVSGDTSKATRERLPSTPIFHSCEGHPQHHLGGILPISIFLPSSLSSQCLQWPGRKGLCQDQCPSRAAILHFALEQVRSCTIRVKYPALRQPSLEVSQAGPSTGAQLGPRDAHLKLGGLVVSGYHFMEEDGTPCGGKVDAKLDPAEVLLRHGIDVSGASRGSTWAVAGLISTANELMSSFALNSDSLAKAQRRKSAKAQNLVDVVIPALFGRQDNELRSHDETSCDQSRQCVTSCDRSAHLATVRASEKPAPLQYTMLLSIDTSYLEW